MLYYLIVALALIFSIAVVSELNRHPDEYHHFVVSKYYFNHWIPPKIGDPEVTNTYSCYGISYINQLGVDYFLSGKFAFLINGIIKNEVKSVRFFNVFLFVSFLIFSFYRYRKDSESIAVFFPLVVTPQVWYIFSYINNDAFPLFLSFLVLSEISYKESFLNRFLNSDLKLKPKAWAGGIITGFLLGILSLSKMNYSVFLLFIGFWFIYHMLRIKEGKDDTLDRNPHPKLKRRIDKGLLMKYSFITLVALSIFAMRHGLDILTNGLDRSQRAAAYCEEMAQYPFKPSTMRSDIQNAYEGLALRNRGVKYTELFSKWNWHKISFASLVGVYGYMNIFSPPSYYQVMLSLYLLLGIYLIFTISVHGDARNRVLMVAAILFISLMTFISTYYSWMNAFQPQGRYLFPVIGLIGLLIDQSRKNLNHWVMHAFLLTLFILSLYSFVFVALKYV